MQILGMPSSLAASRLDTRESETTTSGLKVSIKLTSALTCLRKVNEAKKGPGFTAVCLKSIDPSGLTWNPIGGALKAEDSHAQYSVYHLDTWKMRLQNVLL